MKFIDGQRMAQSERSSVPTSRRGFDTPRQSRRLGSPQTSNSTGAGSKYFQSKSEMNLPWMPKLTSAAMAAVSNEDSASARSRIQESTHSSTGRESLHSTKHSPHRSSFLHRMAARISYAERFSGYAPLIASAMSAARISYSGDGVSYQVNTMMLD